MDTLDLGGEHGGGIEVGDLRQNVVGEGGGGIAKDALQALQADIRASVRIGIGIRGIHDDLKDVETIRRHIVAIERELDMLGACTPRAAVSVGHGGHRLRCGVRGKAGGDHETDGLVGHRDALGGSSLDGRWGGRRESLKRPTC